jgi:ATP-dependent DNA helicase RecG
MLEDCKELGVPEPKFEEYSGGFAVIFKFKESIGSLVKKNHSEKFNIRQKAILQFLIETKAASIQQIFDHLIIKFTQVPSKKTIVRDLNYLKSLNLIKSQGEKRGLVWVIVSL